MVYVPINQYYRIKKIGIGTYLIPINRTQQSSTSYFPFPRWGHPDKLQKFSKFSLTNIKCAFHKQSSKNVFFNIKFKSKYRRQNVFSNLK